MTKRLLILEDDSMVSGMMQIMLERSGFECDIVANEDDALRMFLDSHQSNRKYAAVIFDLVLQEDSLGGLHTLKRIKEIAPEVKTILCSGFCSSPVVRNYKNYGFDSCLNKPFTGHSLKAALDDFAEHSS